MAYSRPPWRNASSHSMSRNIAILILSQFLASLASGIFDIALVWLVLDGTDAIETVGIVIFLRYIPYAIFGLIGGWAGDAWNRRVIAMATDLIRALVLFMAALCIALSFDLVVILATLGFLLTVARSFFQPAMQAMIPNLCEEEHLERVNAIFHGLREFLGILAPLVGGFLLLYLSAEFILTLIGLLFLLSAVLIFFLSYDEKARVNPGGPISGYRDLLKYFLDQNPGILIAIGVTATSILAVGGFLSLLIPMQLNLAYPENPEHLGIVMASIAAGTLAGAGVLAVTRLRATLESMYIGWFAYGLTILLFILPLDMQILMAVGFVLGVVGALPDVMFVTIIQKTVPRECLSRTFALFSTLANFGEAFSAPLFASIVSAAGLGMAFLVSGLSASILAVLGLTLSFVLWDGKNRMMRR